MRSDWGETQFFTILYQIYWDKIWKRERERERERGRERQRKLDRWHVQEKFTDRLNSSEPNLWHGVNEALMLAWRKLIKIMTFIHKVN